MDVPSPQGGKVLKVLVKEGDTVSEGDAIVEIEAEGGGDADQAEEDTSAEASSAEAEEAPADEAPAEPAAKSGGGSRTVEIKVPDLGALPMSRSSRWRPARATRSTPRTP